MRSWMEPLTMSSEGSSGRKSLPSKIMMNTKSSMRRSRSFTLIHEAFDGCRSRKRYSRRTEMWKISHLCCGLEERTNHGQWALRD